MHLGQFKERLNQLEQRVKRASEQKPAIDRPELESLLPAILSRWPAISAYLNDRADCPCPHTLADYYRAEIMPAGYPEQRRQAAALGLAQVFIKMGHLPPGFEWNNDGFIDCLVTNDIIGPECNPANCWRCELATIEQNEQAARDSWAAQFGSEPQGLHAHHVAGKYDE